MIQRFSKNFEKLLKQCRILIIITQRSPQRKEKNLRQPQYRTGSDIHGRGCYFLVKAPNFVDVI
jgi:hypothetical protein